MWDVSSSWSRDCSIENPKEAETANIAYEVSDEFCPGDVYHHNKSDPDKDKIIDKILVYLVGKNNVETKDIRILFSMAVL